MVTKGHVDSIVRCHTEMILPGCEQVLFGT